MVEQNDTPWTYPSDRELILRSKINIGWSVHSHRLFRRVDVLSDSEIGFILQVISRAEEIEIYEQQRIRGLVERLENIKKNTLENGSKSCSMCGVPFGMLKSSISTCYDCIKSVCSKCCVDTYSVAHDPCMLCKICAEDRELWKKSGGWFYGSLPIYGKRSRKLSVSPSIGRATWAHRTPEIVRLESFEAAENENNGERFLRSSWANLSTQTGNSDNELESPDEFEMTTSFFGSTDSGFLKPMNDNIRREVFKVPNKRSGRKGDRYSKEHRTFLKDGSAPFDQNDCTACREFEAVGTNVAAKLKKMNRTQQIYAESLISQVLTEGLLHMLSEKTDVREFRASNCRRITAMPSNSLVHFHKETDKQLRNDEATFSLFMITVSVTVLYYVIRFCVM